MMVCTADGLRRLLRHTRENRLHAVYVLAVTPGMVGGDLLGSFPWPWAVLSAAVPPARLRLVVVLDIVEKHRAEHSRLTGL